jgi:hypothetical protein
MYARPGPASLCPVLPIGAVLTAEVGANLRELMDRMGHSTTRAASIYQHRTSLRDRMIADQISKRAEAERPHRARNGHKTKRTPHEGYHAAFGKHRASCAFTHGAGDGIEPALSAWEAVRFGLPHRLTCGAGCPRVTVRDRSSPRLIAR